MKCSICGKTTTWDESIGRKAFIVCPECFEKIVQNLIKENNWSRYGAVSEAYKEIIKRG